MDRMEIARLQETLISTLRQNGALHTARIEEAFRKVPRHLFLPDEPIEKVYSDIAIAVKRTKDGQWISSSSQPTMMAIMLEQLDLHPGHKVLEIGTGSGYNAALMAEIIGPDGMVVTVDIQPDLIEQARRNLEKTGIANVQMVVGDGAAGFLEGAPFDRIILTAASWVIAPAWREQLVEGGRLVLPLDLGGVQKSVAFERQGDELVSRSIFSCGFMTLQGAYAAPEPNHTPISADQSVMLSSPKSAPIDIETFSNWLKAPATDLLTGVQVKISEILTDLLLWLNNHPGGQWANLTATNEKALEQNLPALFAWAGEGKRTESIIFLSADGAAALVHPLDKPLTWIDWNLPEEEQPPDLPFQIGVRPLGPDDHIAQQVVTLIRAWADEGKPATSNIHLRAVPAEKEIRLVEGEFLLDKPYTRIVLWYA